ncbi:Thymidylate kinase [compost metagenome]
MQHSYPGLLVAFEGVDGAGKTTQATLLETRLRDMGFEAILTKEPTDSEYGRRIRQIAREGRIGITLEEELDLFLKDRELDVNETIEPVLKRGGIVLMDRYYFSNIAYQGALGLDPAAIQQVNEERFPTPDLTLLFVISPEESTRRISEGREGGTNLGYEKLDFLKQVEAVYEGIQSAGLQRIDARLPLEAVTEQIWTAIEPLLDRLPAKSAT